MNRYVLTILILFSHAAISSENSCKVEGYTVGFFNGVKTTFDNAKLGMKKLKKTVNMTSYHEENIDYQLFYNDSLIDESSLYLLVDLAETFEQRAVELSNMTQPWEGFWEIVNDRQDSYILINMAKVIPRFTDYLSDVFSTYVNIRVRDSLLDLAEQLNLNSPNTQEVRVQHRLINDSLTWKGKKLIYVAHSQGNLWVNEAYNYILNEDNGYTEDNIKIVHIAPASPDINGDYILSNKDVVIRGLIATGWDSVVKPNTSPSFSFSDISGHGLTEVYLQDEDTRSKIYTVVYEDFMKVTKPEMEDYLFEMTYDYTPNFVTTHGPADIKIVDNIQDLDDDLDIWFEYRYLRYKKLTPFPGIETVALEHDNSSRNQSILKITECNNIPNEKNFILGEYSAADEGLVLMWPYLPPNIETHITVRDRYGFILQKDKVSYNENRDGGLVYLGSLIGFRAEYPYTDIEKEYLENNNLEGRHSLYSDWLYFMFQS